MSDSWSMDLAREVQVYSSPADSSQVSPINALGDDESEYECILQLTNIADDGYATSNSVEVDSYSEKGQEESQTDRTDNKCQGEYQKTREEHLNERRKRRNNVEGQIRKNNKNKKQRDRVADESSYLELLKQTLLKMNMMKETPKRGFTKGVTLRGVRNLIELIESSRNHGQIN